MSDTISRQAVVVELRKHASWFNDAVNDVLSDIEEKIKKMPPEPHWIPVTERLPENGEQVLVYARSVHYALAKYDEMREADGKYKKQWVTFDAWKPFYTIKDVMAWMPLPEHYRRVTT